MNTAEKGQETSWFSRRHETREEHDVARERYQKLQSDKAQLAEVNRIGRSQRTPADQIALLDKRLGVGKGAIVERANLALKMAEERLAPKGPGVKKNADGSAQVTINTVGKDAWKEIMGFHAKVQAAKLEVRGYRCMRRFGLSPRTA